ncbi:hypothetical protein AB0A76_32725 [Streptomyces exfoliatus]|uniref:Uncharacterized protein n=1 Tax=Streptomyces exfoliatus TaxID=1905 RepID=A0ABV3D6W8_STREX
MSFQKDVLMLGHTSVADSAHLAVRELENAYRAAADLAAPHSEAGGTQLAWEDRYTSLQDRLEELTGFMGQAMFGDGAQ